MHTPDPTQSPDEASDPLAFTPVPRKKARVDGWSPEHQRAFIAAVAATGSTRRAAAAVGKSATGAHTLRRQPGAESFSAAWDAALAIAAQEGRRRIAAGVEAVTEEARSWAPPPKPWSRAATRQPRATAAVPQPDDGQEEQAAQDWLSTILGKYALKVAAEREARLAGRIVAADFYLRQLTVIEVAIDLLSGDGWRAMREFRRDGHALVHIAETPFSRLLDAVRREHWAEAGEPPRPQPIPRALLAEHDGYATEPLEYLRGATPAGIAEQQQCFDARHARDAAEQVEWEAEARRDYDRRRDSAAGT